MGTPTQIVIGALPDPGNPGTAVLPLVNWIDALALLSDPNAEVCGQGQIHRSSASRFFSKEKDPSWNLPAGKQIVIAPNPARDKAELFIKLAVASRARLILLNTAGEGMLNQDLGSLSAGSHRVPLGLQRLASGSYFALLQTDEGFGYVTRQSFKLAVIK
jgi:hypothetical protein